MHLHIFFVLLKLSLFACHEFYSNDQIVVGNIKKRDQIPLHEYQINRRFSDNLNYRKTRDLRDLDGRKRYLNKRENLERDGYNSINNDLSRTINSIIERNINEYDRKREQDKRGNDRRRGEINNRQSYDATKNGVDELDKRFEQSEREKKSLENSEDRLKNLHQDLRWLTINNDEGIGIGI